MWDQFYNFFVIAFYRVWSINRKITKIIKFKFKFYLFYSVVQKKINFVIYIKKKSIQENILDNCTSKSQCWWIIIDWQTHCLIHCIVWPIPVIGAFMSIWGHIHLSMFRAISNLTENEAQSWAAMRVCSFSAGWSLHWSQNHFIHIYCFNSVLIQFEIKIPITQWAQINFSTLSLNFDIWLRNRWFCNNDQPKINFSATIQPKINQVWKWNIMLKSGWNFVDSGLIFGWS